MNINSKFLVYSNIHGKNLLAWETFMYYVITKEVGVTENDNFWLIFTTEGNPKEEGMGVRKPQPNLHYVVHGWSLASRRFYSHTPSNSQATFLLQQAWSKNLFWETRLENFVTQFSVSSPPTNNTTYCVTSQQCTLLYITAKCTLLRLLTLKFVNEWVAGTVHNNLQIWPKDLVLLWFQNENCFEPV